MKVRYTGKSTVVVWNKDERIEMKKGDETELDKLPEGGCFEEVKPTKKPKSEKSETKDKGE